MTDAEWAVVRDAMPVSAWPESRGGLPEGDCHRVMLDAIRYVTDNGIKWRSMPVDFPAWDQMYAFFRRWREHGLAQEFHDRLRRRAREAEGRDQEPTAAVIDSQSVKGAASVPAATRGYDGGKRIVTFLVVAIQETIFLVLTPLPVSATRTAAATAD